MNTEHLDLEPLLLEVTDLRQYRTCQRVVFYRYCLPDIRPLTGKMEEGIERHHEEKDREERRSLQAYGLETGERHYDVLLQSTELGIVGLIDMVILTADEAIPVEYKLTRRAIGAHIKAQLTAYALLIEEHWHIPVKRGFIHRIGQRQAEEIAITTRQRNDTANIIANIRHMIMHESMPEPTKNRGLCSDCEFRRFCNDVF